MSGWKIANATSEVVSVNGEAGVVVLDATNIPFTPDGGITATDVQDAVASIGADWPLLT